MKGNFPKIFFFFKFNFKASQVYFILIDLKKKNLFYCQYILLLDIRSLHR